MAAAKPKDRACFSHVCTVLYQHSGQQGTMYGMLLESIQHFVLERFGEEAWAQVLRQAGLANTIFATHKRYPDDIMTRLALKCSEILPGLDYSGSNCTADDYMHYFGTCFVKYFTHYGYDRIMRVAGRHYRDFLNGIDNLHETMRFSYPKMLSPSFYVSDEHEHGCLLHYRSKRIGFTQYVIGQLQACGQRFYNTEVIVNILKEKITENGCHVIFQLQFDNHAVKLSHRHPHRKMSSVQRYSNINIRTFLKVFTFSIIFNKELVITHVGDTLKMLFSQESLIGSHINSKFSLRRPQMDLVWEDILCLQSVIFELESTQPIKRLSCMNSAMSSTSPNSPEATRTLLLKGQMRHLKDLDSMAFLCSPLLSNLEELCSMGLYINDLNMYDSGRDMVMAGWQHASRLEYSIEKQILKSQQIADNLRQLDQWKSRSEELLYSMIPQQIAVRLKNGEDPISTCEVFEQVTIMFSYLLGFNEMCAQVTPMELVKCFNTVFTIFDAIVDKHKVFKVETLGDAVYMVAGGVPDRRSDHATSAAHVALELVESMKLFTLPTTHHQKLQIRIGMHTGSVVAGVVGKRMPQYCLFGDTVNTASRMQTNSLPGRIHLSEPCQRWLKGSEFVNVFRGRVHIKGKGQMNTYWLAGIRGDPSAERAATLLRQEQSKTLTLSLNNTCDAYDLHRRRQKSEQCIFETGPSPVSSEQRLSRSASADLSGEETPDIGSEKSRVSVASHSNDGERSPVYFTTGISDSSPSPSPEDQEDVGGITLNFTSETETPESCGSVSKKIADVSQEILFLECPCSIGSETGPDSYNKKLDFAQSRCKSFAMDMSSYFTDEMNRENLHQQSGAVDIENIFPNMRQYRSNSIAAGNLLCGNCFSKEECLSRCESAEAHLETLSSRSNVNIIQCTWPKVPSDHVTSNSQSKSTTELESANQEHDLICFDSMNDLTCLTHKPFRMNPQIFAMSARKSLLDMSLDET